MPRISPALGDVSLEGGVFAFPDFDIRIVEKYQIAPTCAELLTASTLTRLDDHWMSLW
jgi:hypothetical protein